MRKRGRRWRGRRLWFAVLAVALLAVAGAGWGAAASGGSVRVHEQAQFVAVPGARLDTSYFHTPGPQRRPAVLLAHGFGGSKDDERAQAEQLARAGYAVLTWTARGFGRSTGLIGLNDPTAEVADVSRLIDWLARQPQVRLDAPGDPRVGIAGASYGGAVALLAAGYDHRVDAIAPALTYWNLSQALFPGGVFKKQWAGLLFTSATDTPAAAPTPAPGGGSGSATPQPGAPGAGAQGAASSASVDLSGSVRVPAAEATSTSASPAAPAACGRFEPQLCALYQRVAVTGTPTAADEALLAARSPSAVASRIDVPTLLTQGQTDSLFPLAQSDEAARAIRANGAPVAVDWVPGGHDGGDTESKRVQARTLQWFDRYLKGDAAADTGPGFRTTRSSSVSSADGTVQLTSASSAAYPGLRSGPRDVPLTGPAQTFANPPGGAPPSLSALPGLGGLAQLADVGGELSAAEDPPGEYARFDSAPLRTALQVTGTPAITLRVGSSAAQAVLFAKVYDVAPDGTTTLPGGQVTPLRVTGLGPGRTATVTVALPAIDHRFASGHRLRLVVAATDLGYATPAAPAAYTMALASGTTTAAGATTTAALSVPTAPTVHAAAPGVPGWTWVLPIPAAALAALLLLGARGRRRALPPPDPALAGVPLVVRDLSKRYAGSADRYAVRDLGFTVERGQVLGLLGPNGAGKTTTLRMLMGLIRPDAGEIRIFGHAVRPGAPVLSRVGAFVEGSGFLPHLTGRANLDLYWRATGRPAADAHTDEALAIAGLGEALDRAVRTYSQGMRQRLAIAQAMLGLPDLLILDEPTNGLDPPQIREMREVMIRYAASGRTVLVSSHLLAEVEQSCTDLVIMRQGRLVQAGPTAEITGSANTLLVTLAGEPDAAAAAAAEHVAAVAALPGVAAARPAEAGLLVELDGATPAELMAGLLVLGLPLLGVAPYRRLEDAFLTLTADPGPDQQPDPQPAGSAP